MEATAQRARRVLITGASGFVGEAICRHLTQRECDVRAAVRTVAAQGASDPADRVEVGDIGPDTDWREALAGITDIIHLAARVHVMQDDGLEPVSAYREVNVDGTRRLAEQAAEAGVRRFVFLSSIKVNGERTRSEPFRSRDEPSPQDAYARSKWEAEQALASVAAGTGLEIVTIRPPLVYGVGVRANFLRLMRLIERGWPLPLAGIDNRRSLVSLDNLVDLLVHCIAAPAGAGKTFLVSDGEDLSTPELIRRIAQAMGREPRLFHVSPKLLSSAARLLGKRELFDRLGGSLQVDISETRRQLNWTPPQSVDEAIAQTVEWYLREGRKARV